MRTITEGRLTCLRIPSRRFARRPLPTAAYGAFRFHEREELSPRPAQGRGRPPFLRDLPSGGISCPAAPALDDVRPLPAREPHPSALRSRIPGPPTLPRQAARPLPAISRPALRRDPSERTV